MSSNYIDVSGDIGLHGQITAKIGGIVLEDAFSDPTVDLKHERETVDHEIVTGHDVYTDEGIDFVVQALGRSAPEIDIEMWVTQEQLSRAENLVANDTIDIRTARYTGTVVPRDVSVDYSRVYHEEHGWIFEVSITASGIEATGFSGTDIGGSGAGVATPFKIE